MCIRDRAIVVGVPYDYDITRMVVTEMNLSEAVSYTHLRGFDSRCSPYSLRKSIAQLDRAGYSLFSFVTLFFTLT